MKRKNQIIGQFSARLIEMLESPAWKVLSLSARRVIDRIEIEHAHHGGNDNGNLPVTKYDFMQYGISGRLVAPAIREAEALGFIRMKRGRGGNAEHRQPNRFFLTFAHGRGSRDYSPTHDWRKIKTIEEAQAIAEAARASKNATAVAFGRRSWGVRKNRNRNHKVVPKPVSQSGPEKPKSPVSQSGPTGQSHKVVPLSISRGGGWGSGRSSSCLLEPAPPPWVPYSQRDIDHQRRSRESLMAYVANVIEEQLHDLDPSRVRARQRAQARARELCLFDPVGAGG